MNFELDCDMTYLIGVILGDGYISNSSKSKKDKSKDYRISIDLSDKKYLSSEIFPIFRKLTNTKSVPKERNQKNRKSRLYLMIRHKELYFFLTKNMGLPSGKKSGRIKVPEKIINLDLELKRHFIAGVFDTDGGFRGGSLGLSTKSQIFRDDLILLLKELGFSCSEDMWLNKKYNQNYFGFRILKRDIVKFLKKIPLRNHEKLDGIHRRFSICGSAGAVKRAGKSFSQRKLGYA
jgi:intein/homing endonuclease